MFTRYIREEKNPYFPKRKDIHGKACTNKMPASDDAGGHSFVSYVFLLLLEFQFQTYHQHAAW